MPVGMSLRKRSRDHLRELASPPALVAGSQDESRVEDSLLIFWTRHPEQPFLVDLTVLRSGQLERPTNGSWAGPFSGRPKLIEQLAPAIREYLLVASAPRAKSFVRSLRAWWRLFDAVENDTTSTGTPLTLSGVEDLTELHGQVALDRKFSSHHIHDLRRVASITRTALGMRPLHWVGPENDRRKRHLPPEDKVTLVWRALKRGWLDAVDRWSRTEQLLIGRPPNRCPSNTSEHIEEERLLKNYVRFRSVQQGLRDSGRHFPTAAEIRGSMTASKFSDEGLTIGDMLAGFYPTPTDIRMAFMLCLASSGWNAQTFLDLRVEIEEEATTRTPFLEDHPDDASRYILRGIKSRGKTEHFLYGDWKTDRSPGVVLRTLVHKTWPLRMQLLSGLRQKRSALQKALDDGEERTSIDAIRNEIHSLEQGIRSPWLFCNYHGVVGWLKGLDYGRSPTNNKRTFLEEVIAAINERRTGTDVVPYITGGDFRDAFAAFVWRSTGGSVLHVMKALGHRSVRTTTIYLNNTVVNAESAQIFRTFSNSMWHEIRNQRRLDASIVAKWTRDGTVSEVERERLGDFRALKRSRIGVRCKDPHHPPEDLDPNFVADGVSLCTVQRCTLCLQNAVITPDSLPGLVMRMAELRWLKVNMPVDSFVDREFQQEYDNTTAALSGFDADDVTTGIADWEQRIDSGLHRVIEFQGIHQPRGVA